MFTDKLLRSIPPFRGKRRLANLLMKSTIGSAKDIIVLGKYNTRYILPNLKDNISLDIFVNGIYEKGTIDLLDRLLPRGGHYLDLGANIGAILIPLTKRRADIHSIAVEAAPWIFTYLKKNIEMNGLNDVVTINKALFDKEGIELDFFSPEEKFGKGSLSSVFSKKAVKVMTTTVDSIASDCEFPTIDLMKVDVEGYEYFVFKGAEDLLRSPHPPKIIFEFVDWAEKQAMGLQPGAAQNYLLAMGYQLFVVKENGSITKINQVIKSGGYNLLAIKEVQK